MEVGFIGLGIMGSRMAANLQRAGYTLVIHNRTQAKAETLVSNGAIWANTPAEVGRQVSLLFTVLANPKAVRASTLGDNGFLDQLQPGSIWVDCSTVNPSFSRLMAAKATEREVRFLDAPVAGTKGPAESGELLFIVGGKQDDIEACRPCFEAMGRDVIHVGPASMGTSIKMVFNKMLGEAMLSFAEALSLGESLGIPRDTLLNMVPGSAIAAPFLASKAAKIKNGDYEAEFPLKWMHKDLQMVATTAYEENIPVPLANAAKEIYALASQKGLANEDFSAIYRFVSEGDD